VGLVYGEDDIFNVFFGMSCNIQEICRRFFKYNIGNFRRIVKKEGNTQEAGE